LVKKSGTVRWIFRIRRRIDCGTIGSFDSKHSPGSFSEVRSTPSALRTTRRPALRPSPSGSLKKLFQKLSGVMIYRDGFGVRIPPDWLELGTGVTSGKSWYGLRVQNTVGHIDITTEGNSALVEKSDREGFVDTPLGDSSIDGLEDPGRSERYHRGPTEIGGAGYQKSQDR